MARMIGIDLGTTFSLAAVMADGSPAILPNAEGGRLTPSVAVLSGGRRVIRSIKRRMGTGDRVHADGRDYSPEDISAMILRKIKAGAEARLGEKVERAVITVPAYFNDNQRKATRQAGRLAGLEVARLLSEPTAAALAYGLHLRDIHNILVWDLGGGTFDVSVLELGRGFFQVKAVNGDPRLGGDDYDLRLARRLAEAFALAPDGPAAEDLRRAAEEAKIALSTRDKVVARLSLPPSPGSGPPSPGSGPPSPGSGPPSPGSGPPGGLREAEISRVELEELTRDLTARMARPTRQALADAGLMPADIERVILVGGATRMPAVWRLARELLGQDPYPHAINPDEAVALGAAVQAGMLSGAVAGMVLVDVTPLSLGIETQGGIFTRLIARNTPIPSTRSRIFTNAEDDQTSVETHVLQGERPLARDNASLGRFRLRDIEPQPRGHARLEVSFAIDVDGVVRVCARDLQTETSREVEIAALDGSSQKEAAGIIDDAGLHAEEDSRLLGEAQARLRAESLIHAAQSHIRETRARPGARDLGAGAPADMARRLEDCERAVLELNSALAAGAAADISAKAAALHSAVRLLAASAPTT